METSFFEKVSQAFEGLRKTFHLFITDIDEDEVAVWSDGFALLVFRVPHEGVSIQYVDLDYKNEYVEFVNFVDVASFIIKTRTWTVEHSVPYGDDFEAIVTRDLRWYALTLERAVPDILEGKKDWLTLEAARPTKSGIRFHDLLRKLVV